MPSTSSGSRKWTLYMFAGLAGLIGFGCLCYRSACLPTVRRVVVSLQLLHTPSRDGSYEVEASADISTTASGSHSTHTVSNIDIRVLRHSLGYQNVAEVFLLRSRAVYVFSGPSACPTWRAKFISDRGSILPTVRLLMNKTGGVCLIASDGSKCESYWLSESGEFELDSGVRARELLRSSYRDAFAPEDVYWSYLLVIFSKVFGYKCGDVDFSKPVSTEELFRLWSDAELVAPLKN